jgi:hypothetical protein
MRKQATRCTQQELACLAHWQSKGYRFKPGEPIPTSTMTPPSFATRHPVLDALLGGMLLLIGFGSMAAIWFAKASGLI